MTEAHRQFWRDVVAIERAHMVSLRGLLDRAPDPVAEDELSLILHASAKGLARARESLGEREGSP